MMRYFVGFIMTIGLIILLIVLLFGGGGNKPKVPNTPRTLYSYANSDAETRMTVDGLINSQQEHVQLVISVNKDQTTYQQIQGYDGHVVKQQTYHNTENAYDVFLHALAHSGFTKGDISPALKDERGYCPVGQRYIFELKDNGKDIERFWATSCGSPKTYRGLLNQTIRLFRAQIPDYNTLTQDISLQ